MDKGIKEAMSRQTTPRLASNFTYRTLERIRQEEARREDDGTLRNIFRGCRASSTFLPGGYDRRRFCAAGCSLLATVGDIQLLAAEEIQAFIEVIR